jgi:hypothetical protein
MISFILLVFVLIHSLLLILINRFMINNFWPLLMLLKNDITCKSWTWIHCVLWSQEPWVCHDYLCFKSMGQVWWTLSLSWLWFVITYCSKHQQRKPNALSHHSYLMPKEYFVFNEGDVAYEQQCDVIFKYCQNFLMTRPFFVKFVKIWKKPPTIGIQGQLRSHCQIQKKSTDHANFEFQNGLLYCDGLLYVLSGLVWLQILQARHDIVGANHFGFNKTMEFMS